MLNKKRLIVCDYPSKYTFPSFGFGSSEKRLWHFAKTASEIRNIEVILTGPLWKPEYVPDALYFRPRLDKKTVNDFIKKFGRVDYLFAGHEYFDKDEYAIPFLKAANKLISYQLHPYEYKKISFDAKSKHLFCYSQEMVEKYKNQLPHQALLFHSGVNENPYFTEEPDNYLIWIGRLDADKSPHYAVLAAEELNIPLYILGKTVYQPEYEEKYRHILNSSNVKRLGVIFGPDKMKLISEARCGIYTIGPDYSEAGAGVLGEIIASGVPLAGMTWKGNDAVCAAIDEGLTGSMVAVNKSMSDRIIAKKLAATIEKCLLLDRRKSFKIGSYKFNPTRLVENIFDIIDKS